MPSAEVRRILAIWDHATADELAAGIAWYDRAREASEALAAGSTLSTEHAAGIIAALSPRAHWSVNVRWAAKIVRAKSHRKGCPAVGLGDARRKAWRIAAGEDPATVLRGPKVRAFWLAIIGDSDAVVIDIWAARAAEGRDNPRPPEGARYDELADAYRAAAEMRGVQPREMQAAVWVHIRGRAD